MDAAKYYDNLAEQTKNFNQKNKIRQLSKTAILFADSFIQIRIIKTKLL